MNLFTIFPNNTRATAVFFFYNSIPALKTYLGYVFAPNSFICVNLSVFPGVLFALKVLSHHYDSGGVTYVMGLPVPNRYASWVELVLIHITSPG